MVFRGETLLLVLEFYLCPLLFERDVIFVKSVIWLYSRGLCLSTRALFSIVLCMADVKMLDLGPPPPPITDDSLTFEAYFLFFCPSLLIIFSFSMQQSRLKQLLER